MMSQIRNFDRFFARRTGFGLIDLLCRAKLRGADTQAFAKQSALWSSQGPDHQIRVPVKVGLSFVR